MSSHVTSFVPNLPFVAMQQNSPRPHITDTIFVGILQDVHLAKRNEIKSKIYALHPKDDSLKLPILHFSAEDVDRSAAFQLLQDNRIIHPGHIIGGAARNILAGWDFGDVDLEYYLSCHSEGIDQTLSIIYQQIISFVREQLVKNSPDKNKLPQLKDSEIVHTYLYRKIKITTTQRIISHFGLGGIDINFVFDLDPNCRKSIFSSDGFRVSLNENNVISSYGYTYCNELAFQKALNDLYFGNLIIVDPKNVYRLVFSLTHRLTQGYSIPKEFKVVYAQVAFDQIIEQFKLNANHQSSNPTLGKCFTEYLKNHYDGNQFAQAIYFLNFINLLSHCPDSHLNCQAIAEEWLNDHNNQNSDPLFVFASIIKSNPELTTHLITVIQGIFLIEWMRGNSLVSGYTFKTKNNQYELFREHFTCQINGKSFCLTTDCGPDVLALKFLQSWIYLEENFDKKALEPLFIGLGITQFEFSDSSKQLILNQVLSFSRSAPLQKILSLFFKGQFNIRPVLLFLKEKERNPQVCYQVDGLLWNDDVNKCQDNTLVSNDEKMLLNILRSCLTEQKPELVLKNLAKILPLLSKVASTSSSSLQNDLSRVQKGLKILLDHLIQNANTSLLEQIYFILELCVTQNIFTEDHSVFISSICLKGCQRNEHFHDNSQLITRFEKLCCFWMDTEFKSNSKFPNQTSLFFLLIIQKAIKTGSSSDLSKFNKYLDGLRARIVGNDHFEEKIFELKEHLIHRALILKDPVLDSEICQTYLDITKKRKSINLSNGNLSELLLPVIKRMTNDLDDKQKVKIAYQVIHTILKSETSESVIAKIRSILISHMNSSIPYVIEYSGAIASKHGNKSGLGLFTDVKIRNSILNLVAKLKSNNKSELAQEISNLVDQGVKQFELNELFNQIISLFNSSVSKAGIKEEYSCLIQNCAQIIRSSSKDNECLLILEELLKCDYENQFLEIHFLLIKLMVSLRSELVQDALKKLKNQLNLQQYFQCISYQIQKYIESKSSLDLIAACDLWNRDKVVINSYLQKLPTEERFSTKTALLLSLENSLLTISVGTNKYLEQVTECIVDECHQNIGVVGKVWSPELTYDLISKLISQNNETCFNHGEKLFTFCQNEVPLKPAQKLFLVFNLLSKLIENRNVDKDKIVELFKQFICIKKEFELIDSLFNILNTNFDAFLKVYYECINLLPDNSDVELVVIFNDISRLLDLGLLDNRKVLLLDLSKILIQKALCRKSSNLLDLSIDLLKDLFNKGLFVGNWTIEWQQIYVQMLKKVASPNSKDVMNTLIFLIINEVYRETKLTTHFEVFKILYSVDKSINLDWIWKILNQPLYQSDSDSLEIYRKIFSMLPECTDERELGFVNSRIITSKILQGSKFSVTDSITFCFSVFVYLTNLLKKSKKVSIDIPSINELYDFCMKSKAIEELPDSISDQLKKLWLLLVCSSVEEKRLQFFYESLMSLTYTKEEANDLKYIVNCFLHYIMDEPTLFLKIVTEQSFMKLMRHFIDSNLFHWHDNCSAPIFILIESLLQLENDELTNSAMFLLRYYKEKELAYCKSKIGALSKEKSKLVNRKNSNPELVTENSYLCDSSNSELNYYVNKFSGNFLLQVDKAIELCKETECEILLEFFSSTYFRKKFAGTYSKPCPVVAKATAEIGVVFFVTRSNTYGNVPVALEIDGRCYFLENRVKKTYPLFKGNHNGDSKNSNVLVSDPHIKAYIHIKPEKLLILREVLWDSSTKVTNMYTIARLLHEFVDVTIPPPIGFFPISSAMFLYTANAFKFSERIKKVEYHTGNLTINKIQCCVFGRGVLEAVYFYIVINLVCKFMFQPFDKLF